MKSLFFASLLVCSSVFAESNLAQRLYPITSASNIRVSMLCPQGVICMTNGTVVDMTFTLNGCADSLGPVTYKAEQNRETGTLNVYISATGVHNPNSETMSCYRAPTREYRITLVNKYGDVKLKFLK